MEQYADDIYYTYAHVDPENINEVVYVGHGKGSRAWMFNWGATSSNRSAEHNEWCRTQCAKGSHPTDL